MRARVLLIAAICGVAAVVGRAQMKAPITHEALWLLPRVGAPAASPDGKWAVFPVTEPSYNPDDQRSDLWIVPTDGSAEPRRLTFTKAGESSPAWSPDGRRLAFVTKRDDDKSNQIYVLDVAGGGQRRPAGRRVDTRRGVDRVRGDDRSRCRRVHDCADRPLRGPGARRRTAAADDEARELFPAAVLARRQEPLLHRGGRGRAD